MYTNDDFALLTAAGFEELDADWFVNETTGYAIAAPNPVYVVDEHRSPLWTLYKAMPVPGSDAPGYNELSPAYKLCEKVVRTANLMHAIDKM